MDQDDLKEPHILKLKANSTILNLQVWNGIYESSLYGSGVQRRKTKDAFDKFIKTDSVVYAKRRRKLSYVIPHTQNIRRLADPSTVYSFPNLVKETKWTSFATDEESDDIGPVPESYSVVLCPSIPLLPAQGKLRRPTRHPVLPLLQKDKHFLALWRDNGQQQYYTDSLKNNIFYNKRYRLLMLLKKATTPDIDQHLYRSEDAPENLTPNLEQRFAQIHDRVCRQADAFRTLLEELEDLDSDFTTYLGTDAFDPTSWDCNKEWFKATKAIYMSYIN